MIRYWKNDFVYRVTLIEFILDIDLQYRIYKWNGIIIRLYYRGFGILAKSTRFGASIKTKSRVSRITRKPI